jgi:hypothetical protein
MTSKNDLQDDLAVAKNSPEKTGRPKATLARFIDDYSKLVTSIAAFVALTAFASQLDNYDAKLYLSGLCLLAAVLLGIELYRQLPPEPHHWLLKAFSLNLTLLVFGMGWYWVSRFTVVWGPIIFAVIYVFVFAGLPYLFAHFVTKLIVLVAARLFHCQIRAEMKTRIEQVGFFGLIGSLLLCGFWVLYKFCGHPIRIHLPF